MPDPYTNSNMTPPTGGNTWSPDFVPTGGDTPGPAFRSGTIVRGQFQNNLPVTSDYPNASLTVSFEGTRNTADGSEGWPFLNTFRPLQNPALYRGEAPMTPFQVQGANLQWQVSYRSVPDKTATLDLTYALTVDVTDPNLMKHLSSDDAKALQAWIKSNGTTVLGVDFTKYAFAQILGTNQAGKEQEYPLGSPVSALFATDIRPKLGTPAQSNVVIPFGTGATADGYTFIQSFRIVNRYSLASLQLTIYSAQIFSAERVNFGAEQLPCTMMSYAYPVSFTYLPQSQGLIQPTAGTTPNFHVKVFAPDYLTGSPGFAHSLNLRFLIFSLPIEDLSALDEAGAGLSYMSVFIGPTDGTQTVSYSLTPFVTSGGVGRAVHIDESLGGADITQIARLAVEKASGSFTSSPPTGTIWKRLATYDLSSPPNFSDVGPFVAPFLFFDSTGTATSWYRVVIIAANTGNETDLAPAAGSYLASETVLAMRTSIDSSSPTPVTITRRAAPLSSFAEDLPLSQDPIALFLYDEDVPLASPISFERGPWRLRLSVSDTDIAQFFATHVYARFWFQPENEDIDVTNPHKYRTTTELFFRGDSTGTTLVQGIPTQISDLLYLPPAQTTETGNNYLIDITRYADAFSGFNSSTAPSWTLPFGNNVRGRLVVGLYAVCTPAPSSIAANAPDYNSSLSYPTTTITIDGSTSTLDTTISQVLSNTLVARRANYYNSAAFTALSGPIHAAALRAGGTLVAPTVGAWTPYSESFTYDAGVTTGFIDVATLIESPSVVPAALGLSLPFASLGTGVSDAPSFYCDFVTTGKSLGSGRVTAGPWLVQLEVDTDVDSDLIAMDLQFEGMIVATDGTVGERIFRSARMTDAVRSGSGGGQVTYTMATKIPFTVSAGDTQFILRITAWPYSRSGTALDFGALTTQLANLTGGAKPLGLRLNSLSIVNQTLQRLVVTQTDSLLGSPAFYEDLQLVPPLSLDSQQFWYVASSDNLVTAITFSDTGWPISGCLYSPTWFVQLPVNMEVRVGAAGLGDTDLYVRTVPYDPTGSTSESAVSAVENPLTGEHTIAHDVDAPSSGATSQSVGDIVSTFSLPSQSKRIRTLAVPTPLDQARIDTLVSGTSGTSTAQLSGIDASLFPMRMSGGSSHRSASGGDGSVIGLVTQSDEEQGTSLGASLTITGASKDQWVGPNQDLTDSAFGASRRVALNLTKPAVATSPVGGFAYVAGWLDPGIIAVRQLSVFDADASGSVASAAVMIFEGDASDVATLTATLDAATDNYLVPNAFLGKATQTFPAIMCDGSGRVTVVYAVEGNDGYLYGRTCENGQIPGSSFVAATLRGTGVTANSDAAMFGPSLALYPPLKCAAVAFWAGGKIWVTQMPRERNNGTIPTPPQLVAGGQDFTDQTNSANSLFAGLLQAGLIQVNQAGSTEKDVPKQRPGLIYSDHSPSNGLLFVYYRDTNGQLWGRRVTLGGQTEAQVGYGDGSLTLT